MEGPSKEFQHGNDAIQEFQQQLAQQVRPQLGQERLEVVAQPGQGIEQAQQPGRREAIFTQLPVIGEPATKPAAQAAGFFCMLI